MLTVMTCWWWLFRTLKCHRYMCGGGRKEQHGVNSYDMLLVAWDVKDTCVGEVVKTSMVLSVITQIHVRGKEDRQHHVKGYNRLVVAYHNYGMSHIHGGWREDSTASCLRLQQVGGGLSELWHVTYTWWGEGGQASMVLTVMTCWWWLIRTMACQRYTHGGERRASMMLTVMTC
jgi:hypothetical protein